MIEHGVEHDAELAERIGDGFHAQRRGSITVDCSPPDYYRWPSREEIRRRFDAQLRAERGEAWMQANARYLDAQWRGMLDLGLV